MERVKHSEILASAKEILKIYGTSNNQFFDSCRRESVSVKKAQEFLINFYPITEAFALSSFSYCQLIADEIRSKESYNNFVIENENLELFLSKVLRVTSVEFNIDNDIQPSKFHYNAFSRLANKIDIDVIDLKNKRLKLSIESINLANNINDNFRSRNILAGLANIFVIETSALSIVNCMDDIFSNLQDMAGDQLYDKYELEHITLHQVLEVGHSEDASELISLVISSKRNRDELMTHIEKLSRNFNLFWTKLLE